MDIRATLSVKNNGWKVAPSFPLPPDPLALSTPATKDKGWGLGVNKGWGLGVNKDEASGWIRDEASGRIRGEASGWSLHMQYIAE